MKFKSIRAMAVIAGAGLMAVSGFVSATMADQTTAWGPGRPTITLVGDGSTTPGFDHVQFNSIVNNPKYGDERTFLDGAAPSEIPNGDGTFHNVISVTPGQEYWMRVYVHNNADPSLNAAGVGIAKNTKVKIALPAANQVNTSWDVSAAISADNATPQTVWDTMNFQNSSVPFGLSYVAGSAVEYNGLHPTWGQGMQLSDNIVGDGALIGYQNADGIYPGCFQFVSTVFIKVKVNGPELAVSKKVMGPSDAHSATQVTATAGEKLTWFVDYQNNGATNVDNVVVRDQMPTHMTLVPGTVKQFDSNHPNGQQLSDTGLFGTGVGVGTLGPNGSGGYFTYQTTVNNDFPATDCTNDTLTNTAFVHVQGLPEVSSSASAVVNHTCSTTPPPTTPTTPLPQTGPESALAGIFGTGALGYATRAYLRSKRAVVDSLKGIAQR